MDNRKHKHTIILKKVKVVGAPSITLTCLIVFIAPILNVKIGYGYYLLHRSPQFQLTFFITIFIFRDFISFFKDFIELLV